MVCYRAITLTLDALQQVFARDSPSLWKYTIPQRLVLATFLVMSATAGPEQHSKIQCDQRSAALCVAVRRRTEGRSPMTHHRGGRNRGRLPSCSSCQLDERQTAPPTAARAAWARTIATTAGCGCCSSRLQSTFGLRKLECAYTRCACAEQTIASGITDKRPATRDDYPSHNHAC